jgi:cytochrome P450
MSDASLSALFAGHHVQDPYPLYAQLRDAGPAHGYGTSVVVVDHALARSVFHDTERFPGTASRGVKLDDRYALLDSHQLGLQREIAAVEGDYLTAINGRVHHRVRQAAQRDFSPRRLAQLRAAIERLTDELLAPAAEAEEIDIMQVAYRLPLLVVCDILGAPHEDAERLKAWSLAMTSAYARSPMDPEQLLAAHDGMVRLREYFLAAIEANRRDPSRENLLAALDQGGLTEAEIVANAISVIFAGHETSTGALGNVLVALLSERARWERLCRDQELIPGAIEELIRHDAPVQFFIKAAAARVDVGGVTVDEGASVILAIGAANRDPRAFADADTVDLARRPNDHLCFGRGIHFCLGAPLARLEVQVVLRALVTRFPRLELAIARDDIRYRPHISLRGPVTLPVHPGDPALVA